MLAAGWEPLSERRGGWSLWRLDSDVFFVVLKGKSGEYGKLVVSVSSVGGIIEGFLSSFSWRARPRGLWGVFFGWRNQGSWSWFSWESSFFKVSYFEKGSPWLIC